MKYKKPIRTDKVIFVHIPKTGGTSIRMSLKGMHLLKQHRTMDEVPEWCDIDDYFKFTFVRNPWDRILSLYFLILILLVGLQK